MRKIEEVSFILEADETGWPPAAVEWLYVQKMDCGYEVKTPPLFVKGISVGDIVDLVRDSEGRVTQWAHICKSRRSTICIMVHGNAEIDGLLKYLRSLGCNTESLPSYKYYSIDVPEGVPFEKVDEALATVSEDSASVVFPSFRH